MLGGVCVYLRACVFVFLGLAVSCEKKEFYRVRRVGGEVLFSYCKDRECRELSVWPLSPQFVAEAGEGGRTMWVFEVRGDARPIVYGAHDVGYREALPLIEGRTYQIEGCEFELRAGGVEMQYGVGSKCSD